MKIKFKANRFLPKYWPIIKASHASKYYLAKALGRRLEVTVIFDKNILYRAVNESEQGDMLKLFGSKTGINTQTNYEKILVYRTYPDEKLVEFATYIREQEDFYAEDIEAFKVRGTKYWSRIIDPKYALSTSLWAGGTYPPTTPHSFRIEVEIVK